jgi:hypothetical protein
VLGISTHVASSAEQYMHSFFSYAGALLDAFSFFLFKYLCALLGLSNVNIHVNTDVDFRLSYLFSDTVYSLFTYCNVFLLLAVHLKKESPMLNIRMSTRLINKQTVMRVGYIGTTLFPKYKASHIGLTSRSLARFFYGASSFCTFVRNSFNRAACIVGRALDALYTSISGCYTKFRSCNFLSLHSGDVALSELCVRATYNSRTFFSDVCLSLLGSVPLHQGNGTFFAGRILFGLFVGIEV